MCRQTSIRTANELNSICGPQDKILCYSQTRYPVRGLYGVSAGKIPQKVRATAPLVPHLQLWVAITHVSPKDAQALLASH